MSYQRAVVNCRRCYSLKKDSGVPVDEPEEARERAMQALEEEMNRTLVTGLGEIHSNPQKHHDNGDAALSACMNCTYKKPAIAEIFDPSDGAV